MSDLIRTPHQLTQNVKWLHKVALIANSQALILKRSAESKSRPNCWDLPGGNMEWPLITEPTADLHQAEIAREVQEETGLEIKSTTFKLPGLVHLSSFFQPTSQIFTIICGWGVSLENQPQIKLSAEHTQSAWVGLSELTNFDFGQEKGEFVRQILEHALQSSTLPTMD